MSPCPSQLAASGTLRLRRAIPNPKGAASALFLLSGDATAGPIEAIIPDEGLILPARPEHLDLQAFHLRVLHFNDMHGHLARLHSHSVRPVFSKIVWRLRSLREHYADDPTTAVLAVSAGDDLIGSAFDELLGDDEESYQVHAGYHLYSAAGIDAGALGNHDVDMGAVTLGRAIQRDARFPLLSANLAHSPLLNGLYHPAALLVIKGIRVGIIGLTTAAEILPHPGEEIELADPLQTLHNLLPAMRPLCDVLIVLSHLGYSLGASGAPMLDAGDVELARSLPYGSVHLIVGGHSHHVLNEQGLSAGNIVNGIPIVQAGCLGRFLGEVDLLLRPQAAVTNARLTPVDDLPVDEAFYEQEMKPLLSLVQELFSRPLGICSADRELATDFVRNHFAAGELALANFICDALVARCRAAGHTVDFAVIDGSAVRCGLPDSGRLTFGDWFDIMPFADKVRLCQISGVQLRQLLNDNARRTDRYDEPHTERGFLHFSDQIRYAIDPGETRRQARAVDITMDGRPLDQQLNRVFLAACTSFVRELAAPWERYAPWLDDTPWPDLMEFPHVDTRLFLRNELVAYICEQGGVTEASGARRDGRLRFIYPPLARPHYQRQPAANPA